MNLDDAPGAPTDAQAAPVDGGSADGQRTYDQKYVQELRAEAAARRTAQRELEARLAEYERAQADRDAEAARKRGDFEAVEKGYQAKLTEAEKRVSEYQARVVERVRAQAIDTAIAAAGVTDAEIAALLRTHLASRVTVDPETLAVDGDAAEEAGRLAAKLVSARPAPILPGIPGAQATAAEPKTWQEGIRQDTARLARELRKG